MITNLDDEAFISNMEADEFLAALEHPAPPLAPTPLPNKETAPKGVGLPQPGSSGNVNATSRKGKEPANITEKKKLAEVLKAQEEITRNTARELEATKVQAARVAMNKENSALKEELARTQRLVNEQMIGQTSYKKVTTTALPPPAVIRFNEIDEAAQLTIQIPEENIEELCARLKWKTLPPDVDHFIANTWSSESARLTQRVKDYFLMGTETNRNHVDKIIAQFRQDSNEALLHATISFAEQLNKVEPKAMSKRGRTKEAKVNTNTYNKNFMENFKQYATDSFFATPHLNCHDRWAAFPKVTLRNANAATEKIRHPNPARQVRAQAQMTFRPAQNRNPAILRQPQPRLEIPVLATKEENADPKEENVWQKSPNQLKRLDQFDGNPTRSVFKVPPRQASPHPWNRTSSYPSIRLTPPLWLKMSTNSIRYNELAISLQDINMSKCSHLEIPSTIKPWLRKRWYTTDDLESRHIRILSTSPMDYAISQPTLTLHAKNSSPPMPWAKGKLLPKMLTSSYNSSLKNNSTWRHKFSMDYRPPRFNEEPFYSMTYWKTLIQNGQKPWRQNTNVKSLTPSPFLPQTKRRLWDLRLSRCLNSTRHSRNRALMLEMEPKREPTPQSPTTIHATEETSPMIAARLEIVASLKREEVEIDAVALPPAETKRRKTSKENEKRFSIIFQNKRFHGISPNCIKPHKKCNFEYKKSFHKIITKIDKKCGRYENSNKIQKREHRTACTRTMHNKNFNKIKHTNTGIRDTETFMAAQNPIQNRDFSTDCAATTDLSPTSYNRSGSPTRINDTTRSDVKRGGDQQLQLVGTTVTTSHDPITCSSAFTTGSFSKKMVRNFTPYPIMGKTTLGKTTPGLHMGILRFDIPIQQTAFNGNKTAIRQTLSHLKPLRNSIIQTSNSGLCEEGSGNNTAKGNQRHCRDGSTIPPVILTKTERQDSTNCAFQHSLRFKSSPSPRKIQDGDSGFRHTTGGHVSLGSKIRHSRRIFSLIPKPKIVEIMQIQDVEQNTRSTGTAIWHEPGTTNVDENYQTTGDDPTPTRHHNSDLHRRHSGHGTHRVRMSDKPNEINKVIPGLGFLDKMGEDHTPGTNLGIFRVGFQHNLQQDKRPTPEVIKNKPCTPKIYTGNQPHTEDSSTNNRLFHVHKIRHASHPLTDTTLNHSGGANLSPISSGRSRLYTQNVTDTRDDPGPDRVSHKSDQLEWDIVENKDPRFYYTHGCQWKDRMGRKLSTQPNTSEMLRSMGSRIVSSGSNLSTQIAKSGLYNPDQRQTSTAHTILIHSGVGNTSSGIHTPSTGTNTHGLISPQVGIDPDRQHTDRSLPKQDGHIRTNVVRTDIKNRKMVPAEKLHINNGTLTWEGQRDCGQRLAPYMDRQTRLANKTSHFSIHNHPSMVTTGHRPLCRTIQQSASTLLYTTPRSTSIRSRCLFDTMDNLSSSMDKSTVGSSRPDTIENISRQSRSFDISTHMAHTGVVPATLTHVSGLPTASAVGGEDSTAHCITQATPVTIEHTASHLEDFRQHTENQGFSTRAIDIIINGIAPSTRANHEVHRQRWVRWCDQRKYNSLAPTLVMVIEFLTDLFYDDTRLVNRSALTVKQYTDFFGNFFQDYNKNIQSHALMVRFKAGLIKLRPPTTKIWTFDPRILLIEIENGAPTKVCH